MAQILGNASILGDINDVPQRLREPITLACAQYESSQSLEDLDELLAHWRAVLAIAEAAETESESLTIKALQRISLGLSDRHNLAEDAARLEERIHTIRRLIELQGDSAHALAQQKPYACDLADALWQLYVLRKNANDLGACILALRRACALAPDDVDYTAKLGIALALSDPQDLDTHRHEIFRLGLRMLNSQRTSSDTDADYTNLLRYLAFDRFQSSLEADDVDDVLAIGRRTSALGDLRQATLMQVEGLEHRFRTYREISDSDLAIGLLRSLLDHHPDAPEAEAVSVLRVTRDLPAFRPTDDIYVLHQLARCYTLRHLLTRQENRSDIDNAISFDLKAIELHSQSEEPPSCSLDTLRLSLAISYMMRYDSGDLHEDVDDINNAFTLLRDLKGSLDPNDIGPLWHVLYARCLHIRCKTLGGAAATAARREIISVLEEALDRFPQAKYASAKQSILRDLASARYAALTHDMASGLPHEVLLPRLQQVLRTYVEAVQAGSGPVTELDVTQKFCRLYAAYCHTFCLAPEEAEAVFDISTVKKMHLRFLNCIPETMWLGHTLSRRFEEASKLQSVIGTAVTTVFLLQDTGAALEWFEQGRAVVWSQIQGLRTPLDELREKDRNLADELEKLSPELEETGRRAPLPTLGPSDILAWGHAEPVEEPAVTGRRLARQHSVLLDRIRSLDGFQSFLLPKRAETLMRATPAGRAVACINVHDHRCDALIISNAKMHHVRLPKLTPELVGAWRSTLAGYLQGERARAHSIDDPRTATVSHDTPQEGDIRGVLREMWFCVVWPILEVYLDKLNQGDRSHITWCTTGELAFLPLHAAGPHDDVSPNAFDLVVSSYTPNLSSLQLLATVEEPLRSPSILVVARSNAPKLRPLRWTTEESTKVAAHFPSGSGQVLVDEDATIEAVLEHMAKHPYIHLACHGGQDADPMNSAFFLDGALTLKKLMEQKSSNAQLAFLSACETATGDKSVPNEVVHLAAGMLAAGYKSVVATMWSIGDSEAPSVADDFYQAFLAKRVPPNSEGAAGSKRNPDPENEPWADAEGNAAIALHWALQRLRKRVGIHKFVKWMPYIHLGQ